MNDFFAPYAQEFSAVALAHMLAVMSPGADFAIVIRQSVRFGRPTGVWTAAGIACGLALHMVYILVGMGALMQTTPWVARAVALAGAAYLAYLGWGGIRARPAAQSDIDLGDAPAAATVATLTPARAWRVGFLTNAMNVKATLFFLAVFTTVVSTSTPVAVQAAYGAWICGTTFLWFSLVAFAFSRTSVRRGFLRWGHWFDRVMGVVFLALALRLVLG